MGAKRKDAEELHCLLCAVNERRHICGGIFMNEKGLSVLEQYDLDVRSARRGRGSFLVETDKGLKILTEYSGTEGRLSFQSRAMNHLKEAGFEYLDLPVPNRDGNFLVKDREEITYLLREWHEGRECDVKSLADVQEAIRTLAKVHCHFCLEGEEEERNFGELTLLEEFERKNAELRKIRKFIRARRCKNEFEQAFLNCFDIFYEEAEEAREASQSIGQRSLSEESLKKGYMCHGDYNQHHVFFSAEGTAVTDFGRCHYGVQMGDLARFIRKILEKQNWDMAWGDAMMREYIRVRLISEGEEENLRLRLLYPEKFWKLANHYYGSNKAWLPKKNMEKLQSLISQREQKASFLKMLE